MKEVQFYIFNFNLLKILDKRLNKRHVYRNLMITSEIDKRPSECSPLRFTRVYTIRATFEALSSGYFML